MSTDRLTHKLSGWKRSIFDIGLFIWFVIAFAVFLGEKVWAILRPLFR